MDATMFEGIWFILIGMLIGVLLTYSIWMEWIIKNKINMKFRHPNKNFTRRK